MSHPADVDLRVGKGSVFLTRVILSEHQCYRRMNLRLMKDLGASAFYATSVDISPAHVPSLWKISDPAFGIDGGSNALKHVPGQVQIRIYLDQLPMAEAQQRF
jgi:hypothetical protein